MKKSTNMSIKVFISLLLIFAVVNIYANNVVINEFLADNDTTVADPHGEFDDWIELYNNSDSIIYLTNYYLTDDSTDLTKWTFPDTFIGINSYLIIWADDDIGQIGIHANFKLSKSGEEIYLSDFNQIVIDSVIFGQQLQDISFGRYPNGIGCFFNMIPSFEAENTEPAGIDEILYNNINKLYLFQNYPNPFNNITEIQYLLPQNSYVDLTIYNILGQEIKTLISSQQNSGIYNVFWDGRDNNNQKVSTGIYMLKLETEKNIKIQKMIFTE